MTQKSSHRWEPALGEARHRPPGGVRPTLRGQLRDAAQLRQVGKPTRLAVAIAVMVAMACHGSPVGWSWPALRSPWLHMRHPGIQREAWVYIPGESRKNGQAKGMGKRDLQLRIQKTIKILEDQAVA
eukprot:Skav223854  [mRNA]  locus=scaffold2304:440091:443579:- [translate_table: standard]